VISSRPAGAQIRLDGREVGPTPVELPAPAAASVRVSASLAGYEPLETVVQIRPGQEQEVALDLVAVIARVRLTVETEPAGSRVEIVDGPAYRPGIELPAGRYTLEVSAPGHASQRQQVQLGRKEERVRIVLLRSAPAVAGGMRDLGQLPEGESVWAYGVNNRGQVIGTSSPAGGVPQAFMWSSAGLEPIGPDTVIVPSAINDQGEIVGSMVDARGEPRAFRWTASAGLMELDPGRGGSSQARATAINASGQIAGFTIPRGGFSTEMGGGSGQRAFLHTPGAATQFIGTLGGDSSEARGVNAHGEVVGWSTDRQGRQRAFRWSKREGTVDLGTLGGASSLANAINGRGEVTGWSQDAAGRMRAFVWSRQGGMRDRGTLGGSQSHAVSINESGWIVGSSQTAAGEGRAFLSRPDGGMIDFGTLGGAGSAASWVYDSGQVVGMALDGRGRERAILWAP
jgi:probable HAF family extracellular repeat protein